MLLFTLSLLSSHKLNIFECCSANIYFTCSLLRQVIFSHVDVVRDYLTEVATNIAAVTFCWTHKRKKLAYVSNVEVKFSIEKDTSARTEGKRLLKIFTIYDSLYFFAGGQEMSTFYRVVWKYFVCFKFGCELWWLLSSGVSLEVERNYLGKGKVLLFPPTLWSLIKRN